MVVHAILNHFKSHSGKGEDKQKRQATGVRKIVNGLIAQGQDVVVMGDLNEKAKGEGSQVANLSPLYGNNSSLVGCYPLAKFDVVKRPGIFDSCGWRDRFDYILVSKGLAPHFDSEAVFRKGLWGSCKTPPDKWATYQEITNSSEQASDHAAVYIDLDIRTTKEERKALTFQSLQSILQPKSGAAPEPLFRSLKHQPNLYKRPINLHQHSF